MLNSQLWTSVTALLLLQPSLISAECDRRSCSCFADGLVERSLPEPSKAPYDAELDYGFHPGSVLILTGKATGTPDWGTVALKTIGSDGAETTDMQLGHSEDGEDRGLSFEQGESFNITITSEDDDVFKVCVDGVRQGSYRHRADVANINTLQVDGDLELSQVLYYSPETEEPEEPSKQSCKSGMSLQEHDIKPPSTKGPYKTTLDHGLKKGSLLVISGDVLSDEDWGTIDLVSEAEKFVALHFNLRFDQGAVILNSYVDGAWGEEERKEEIPFKAGKEFHVTIKSEETQFLIYVNGKLYTTYKHRLHIDKIDSLRVTGAFNVKGLNYYTPEKC